MDRRIAALLFFLGASTSLGAQARDSTRSLCWRARSLALCKTFLVTEAAIELPVTTTAKTFDDPSGYRFVSDDFETRLAFSVGVMKNTGPKTAQGITLSAFSEQIPNRVEWRYRRWLGPQHGADFSAGVMRGSVRGEYPYGDVDVHGLTAAAGITGTYLGADARFDVARTPDGRVVRATYLNVRAGSRSAPIVTASGYVLLMGLLCLAMCGEGT